jgi:2-octaprenyl-6-methoxyphenol hydroxylase
VLDAAGLWDRLAPHAAPLQVMRIIDAGGEMPVARLVKDFDAADISDAALWLEPAQLAPPARDGGAAGRTAQRQLPPRCRLFARMLTRDAEALVTLTDGAQVAARLVIGADGRNSRCARRWGSPPEPPATARRRWPSP